MKRLLLRRSIYCIFIYFAAQAPSYAVDTSTPQSSDEDVEFNDLFLFNTGNNIDVSRFSKGNPIIPGTFKTQLSLNKRKKLLTDFTFKDNNTPRATPCFTTKILMQIGIKADAIKDKLKDNDEETCIDITSVFPGMSWNFDSGNQELNLNSPQIYIDSHPNGYIDPSLWDDGIVAAMVSYDLNAWRNHSANSTTETAYAGLKYGLNFGPWRLRSRGTLNWDQDSGADYASQDIYLQRDLTRLHSQLLLGDSYTRGDIFNAFNLRGMRIYNDDRMLPGGISTYAPRIHGVATSNAKVTITQSGNKIYESTVPPGEFEISDLSTVGYGSDLVVTVEESDGSQRTFSVPYSSVSQLIRPGNARWDIGLGELNDSNLKTRPKVGYLSGFYGLTDLVTGYAGAQYADNHYFSGLLGLAINTRLGAFSFDTTYSDADISGLGPLSGQSYRLSWSKLIEPTRTSFNVAAYRFSTANYLTLSDAATLTDEIQNNTDNNSNSTYDSYQRMKNQIQINVSQPLAAEKKDYGSLYLTGSWQNYWNSSSTTSQYSVGYNNSFSLGSYSISLQRSYNEYGEKDDRLYLNLSIPLGTLFNHGESPGGFSSINTSLSSDFKKNSTLNTSANGNTEDYRFSYSINASTTHADGSDTRQIGGYGSYNSAYGPLSLSASAADRSNRQTSLSYSGGMLLHAGGLTLAPGSIGDTDTLALVSAPGAEGAHLTTGDGVIDGSGYAIMPYLSAYRENTIGLDISDLESDVEIKNTSTTAVPRSGAVIRVDFETDQGRSLLLDLHRSDNGFIPLGADVLNEQGLSIGAVGQAGQAYVRGVQDNGTLRVIWGNTANSSCTVTYRITESAQKVGLSIMLNNQICQME